MSKVNDITGQRFGRLVVLERVGIDKWRSPTWRCLCDCGKETTVDSHRLKRGNTKSCGCLAREIHSSCLVAYNKSESGRNKTAELNKSNKTTHGMSKSRLYGVWRDMKDRCNNPENPYYADYGGRGISVCGEWSNFEPFRDWALASGYDEFAKRGDCTLNRSDNNGNYCPENCVWSTMKDQSNNRRSNRLIACRGETHTLAEWSSIVGISRETIKTRIRLGWSVEKALYTPVVKKRDR